MAFTLGRGVIDMHLGTGAMRGELGSMRGMLVRGAAIAGAAAAAAMTFAIVKSIRAFAGFEQVMAMVKARTEATTQELASLERQALELGRTTQFTAVQSAQAMAAFAQAGFSVKEILDVMPATLNLAATGQIDMATAAQVTSSVLRGMGLDTSKTTEVIDVLAKASISAFTDITQLGEAMKFAAPKAAALGWRIEEVAAVIMATSQSGIQAGMAGTTLRNVMSKLAKQSKQAAKDLHQYNIEILDTEGNLKGPIALMEAFQLGLAGLSPFEQQGILGGIFEMRAATGFQAMLSAGTDKMREFLEMLDKAGGTSARVAAIQMDTLQGSFLRLNSAMEGAAIVMGRELGPAIRDIVDGLVTFVVITGPLSIRLMRVTRRMHEFAQAGFLLTMMLPIFTKNMRELAELTLRDLFEEMREFDKGAKSPQEILDALAEAMKGFGAATQNTRDELRKLHDQQVRFLGGEEQWRFIQQALLKGPSRGALQQVPGGGARGGGGIRSYGSGGGSAGLFGDLLTSLITILADPTKRAGARSAGRAGFSALEAAIKDLTEVIRQRLGGTAEMDTTDQRGGEIDVNDPLGWDVCPVEVEGDP